jgi:hypothetical protein
MSFDISKFRSQGIRSSGARPNLFNVQLTGVPAEAGMPITQFPFLCKIASIPTSTLGVIEIPYYGRMVKVPGNRTFDNLSVTVINDEDFAIRNGVEKWMAEINNHLENKSAAGGAGSVALFGGITITHSTRDGNDASTPWKFYSAFPVALGEIGLDWGSNDTIEEYTIDFAYDYWQHDQVTK